MKSDQDLFHELSFYTLAHPDPSFIHQHVVDAHAAQHADDASKPISVVFALIGLYLYLEKNFTGKQAQKAHMELAKRRRKWVMPQLPMERGEIGVADVVAAPAGPQRDAIIRGWCEAVWQAWHGSRKEIVDLARTELGIQ
jgi:hypothetical protein